jgi:molybdate transport system substrate-binding protein
VRSLPFLWAAPLWVFSLGLGLGAAACVQAPAGGDVLLVGAPPSLRAAFEEVQAAYRERHSNIAISLVYGAPAELLEKGLPLDVAAVDSADGLHAIDDQLSATDHRGYACNALLVVVRPDSPAIHVRQLVETTWVKRVALADPRGLPSGALAEAVLGRLGLRRELDHKLLYVATPKQVIERVLSGQADAGLILTTDLGTKPAVKVADDDVERQSACYPVALLKTTRHLEAARLFLDELTEGAGRQAFSRRGFSSAARPDETGPNVIR